MEEKKFDEFIKRAAQSEVPLHESLQWENMNIETPSKKRGGYWRWSAVLLLLLLTSVGVFQLTKSETGKDLAVQSELKTPTEKNKLKATSESLYTGENSNQTSNERDKSSSESTAQKIENEGSDYSSMDLDSKEKNTEIEIKKYQNLQKDRELLAERTTKKLNSNGINSEKHTQTNSGNVQQPEANEADIEIENNIDNSNDFSTHNNRNITKVEFEIQDYQEAAESQENSEGISLEEPSALLLLNLKSGRLTSTTLIQDELVNPKEIRTLPVESNKPYLQVLAGINSFKLNQESQFGEQSFGTLSSGQQLSVSLVKPLKRFTYRYGISYTRLHHYNQFTEDLGYVNDLINFDRIYSTRTTSNNNYTEFLSLKLGIEKTLLNTSKVELSPSLIVEPGMKFRSTGIYFNPENSSYENAQELTQSNQFTLSAGLGLNTTFNISDRFKLFLRPEFSWHIRKLQMLSEVNQAIKPQTISISVGFNRFIF